MDLRTATIIYAETSSVRDDGWLIMRRIQMRSVTDAVIWSNS